MYKLKLAQPCTYRDLISSYSSSSEDRSFGPSNVDSPVRLPWPPGMRSSALNVPRRYADYKMVYNTTIYVCFPQPTGGSSRGTVADYAGDTSASGSGSNSNYEMNIHDTKSNV